METPPSARFIRPLPSGSTQPSPLKKFPDNFPRELKELISTLRKCDDLLEKYHFGPEGHHDEIKQELSGHFKKLVNIHPYFYLSRKMIHYLHTRFDFQFPPGCQFSPTPNAKMLFMQFLLKLNLQMYSPYMFYSTHRYSGNYFNHPCLPFKNPYYGHNIAAIAVDSETNKIIAHQFNNNSAMYDTTNHAERRLCRQIKQMYPNQKKFENIDIYSTLEPCHMCYGLMVNLAFKNVYYFQSDPRLENAGQTVHEAESKYNHGRAVLHKYSFDNSIDSEYLEFQRKIETEGNFFFKFQDTVHEQDNGFPNGFPKGVVQKSKSGVPEFLCTNSALKSMKDFVSLDPWDMINNLEDEKVDDDQIWKDFENSEPNIRDAIAEYESKFNKLDIFQKRGLNLM